ncbi:MAG: efflux RND transporter periplasmic adaptor subunit [Candidatus Omnitrophica bacterium]|nr:efflux RND transporter periplasmic adaptor subunit [Candidatus Omnitrophota bacterium]
MKNLKSLFIIAIAFILGIFISPYIRGHKSPAHEETAQEHEEEGVVKLEKESQKLVDFKTVEVKKAPLTENISISGQIAQDANETHNVFPPQSGFVVENTAQLGAVVKKGDVICRIKVEDQDTPIDVKSPYAGVVIGDFDTVGQKVEKISALCAIADLSKVWANFDIYEKDIAKVKIDQKITVRSSAYPEESFEGNIIFISPRVDETTRTIKIRALIQNTDYLLKLGMFVNGVVISHGTEEHLIIPTSAVQTFGDKMVVFVKAGEGEFHKKEIVINSQTAEEVAVREGINAGDMVVTDGAFLLKSGLLKDELEGE